MASTFNCARQFSLVFCACPRLPSGSDLGTIGNESLKQFNIFVIELNGFVSTELTEAWTRVEAPEGPLLVSPVCLIRHNITPCKTR
jgi:hypothetical protein